MFSYACIDQIKTISKLNILPPINKYDIIGTLKCSKSIMNSIDKEIVKQYTAIDYREFLKFMAKVEKKRKNLDKKILDFL